MAKRQRSSSSSSEDTQEFDYICSPYGMLSFPKMKNSWNEEFEDTMPRFLSYQREVYIKRRYSESEIDLHLRGINNEVERSIIKNVLR